jgi:hypothetical protein
MAIKSIASDQDGVFFFDKNQPYEWAQSLSEQYTSAQPFPHIVIDDFLAVDFAEKILDTFPPKDACGVLKKAFMRLSQKRV